MCQDPASTGTVSRDEIDRLVALFRQFEGAAHPLSHACREAEAAFNSLVERIYSEKVKPAYESISLSAFRSHVRNRCRLQVSTEGPPFPCVCAVFTHSSRRSQPTNPFAIQVLAPETAFFQGFAARLPFCQSVPLFPCWQLPSLLERCSKV